MLEPHLIPAQAVLASFLVRISAIRCRDRERRSNVSGCAWVGSGRGASGAAGVAALAFICREPLSGVALSGTVLDLREDFAELGAELGASEDSFLGSGFFRSGVAPLFRSGVAAFLASKEGLNGADEDVTFADGFARSGVCPRSLSWERDRSGVCPRFLSREGLVSADGGFEESGVFFLGDALLPEGLIRAEEGCFLSSDFVASAGAFSLSLPARYRDIIVTRAGSSVVFAWAFAGAGVVSAGAGTTLKPFSFRGVAGKEGTIVSRTLELSSNFLVNELCDSSHLWLISVALLPC
mmetsp:Transcript_88833/g.163118  ORF Transcript_88833/g.163118 Transcript_88833/m.163118 type:complete len:295 (+) Transcript_88833:82-966(+)